MTSFDWDPKNKTILVIVRKPIGLGNDYTSTLYTDISRISEQILTNGALRFMVSERTKYSCWLHAIHKETTAPLRFRTRLVVDKFSRLR